MNEKPKEEKHCIHSGQCSYINCPLNAQRQKTRNVLYFGVATYEDAKNCTVYLDGKED